jgi:hypothetical protein
MKSRGWNKNEFLKKSALLTVVITLSDYATSSKSPIIGAAMPAIEKFNETHSFEEAKKVADEANAKMSPELKKEIDDIVWVMNEAVKAFQEHNPRGRPKLKKRSRGRPKDTGIVET